MSKINYWNRGVGMVPIVTGAASVMDCSDLIDACRGLGVELPLTNVLDVGCGTGRWSKFCKPYIGADVSWDAVEYCQQQGINAVLIDGPDSLPLGHFDTICCFSVFTHIGELGRMEYLTDLITRSDRLLVDIIPGGGGGNISLWTANVATFRNDVTRAGYKVKATYSRVSPDRVEHLYYRLEL